MCQIAVRIGFHQETAAVGPTVGDLVEEILCIFLPALTVLVLEQGSEEVVRLDSVEIRIDAGEGMDEFLLGRFDGKISLGTVGFLGDAFLLAVVIETFAAGDEQGADGGSHIERYAALDLTDAFPGLGEFLVQSLGVLTVLHLLQP